jgi:hypothetical protein
VEYYAGHGTLHVINGNRPADVVTAAVDGAVEEAAAGGSAP